jgi:hypothetical protein
MGADVLDMTSQHCDDHQYSDAVKAYAFLEVVHAVAPFLFALFCGLLPDDELLA